jgi:hydroxypyruvate isomerase
VSFRQSFAWWSLTYGRDGLDPATFLSAAAAAGVEGVEMLPEQLWPAARDAGLELVTLTGHDIKTGFNQPANHVRLHDEVTGAIEVAATNRVHGVIVFAGDRYGADDDTAIDECVDGLTPLATVAEAAGVRLLLELLNSKVDHPGHQCDSSQFGFEVVRRVGSPALRVLYDGYHMQIMEGDLLRTIKENAELIGHVHTAGPPGRRELDDRQEVNWRAVGNTLRAVDYSDWVGHEFIPRRDPIDALRDAVTQLAEHETYHQA